MQPIASARHLSTDYAVGVASVSNITLPCGPYSLQTAPTTVAVYMANHSHVVSLPNRHLNTAPVLVRTSHPVYATNFQQAAAVRPVIHNSFGTSLYLPAAVQYRNNAPVQQQSAYWSSRPQPSPLRQPYITTYNDVGDRLHNVSVQTNFQLVIPPVLGFHARPSHAVGPGAADVRPHVPEPSVPEPVEILSNMQHNPESAHKRYSCLQNRNGPFTVVDKMVLSLHRQARSSSDTVESIEKSNTASQLVQDVDTVQNVDKKQLLNSLKRQLVAAVDSDASDKKHADSNRHESAGMDASPTAEKTAKLDSACTDTQNTTLCAVKKQKRRKKKQALHLLEDICSMVQEQKCFEEELRLRYNLPPVEPQPPARVKQPDNYNDMHVNAKHDSIYPSEEELECIQKLVTVCEKYLQLVSDKLGNRLICGVARVGLVAKGLFLRGDRHLELVVLCSVRPTYRLLSQVVDEFRQQVTAAAEDMYTVVQHAELAGFSVELCTSTSPIKTHCFITVTSALLRHSHDNNGNNATVSQYCDDQSNEGLNRECCLTALAAVRQAKWFQAKANGLPSCVVLLRIMRDFCCCTPAMSGLTMWAVELLVERCLSSCESDVKPGNGLRRVFECLASGILLPGGPGLLDPCEKDSVDATANLSDQQREDITSYAQKMLRLMAFRQIGRVLNMKEPSSWCCRRLS